MPTRIRFTQRFNPQLALVAVFAVIGTWNVVTTRASDHLDTPTVIANPQADIADLYGWTSPDGRQLNLVMTLVGHSFSDRIDYVFHVDSGKVFDKTTATTSITCRFPAPQEAQCQAGDSDRAHGNASSMDGLQGQHHRFRVFAGLRDDPFFNNVRGTRAAYQTAIGAIHRGAGSDEAGCPDFDQATSQEILRQWGHTDGGPGSNFLARWAVSALVVSVDLKVVAKGGKLLAVWGATVGGGKQIDRAGRPLTGNALLGTFATADVSDSLKEQYNAAAPDTSGIFIAEIQKGLAAYDSFDGRCGNQLFAAPDGAQSPQRYRILAGLLADDRLWINSASTQCTQFFAVELAGLARQTGLRKDCGGRTPNYNSANVYRSLLVDGTTTSVDDGLSHDEKQHSAAVFPFLSSPDDQAILH
jgi:hypothetical protein